MEGRSAQVNGLGEIPGEFATMQEVSLTCFREGGVLERTDPERPGGFRPFLYGVARNVARQTEKGNARRREQRLTSEIARNATSKRTALSAAS